MEQDERRRIDEAVTRAIATYVASRTTKIPQFVEQHFSFRGALAPQRRSLLHDIYKVPVNAVWALPAFAAHGMGYLCDKLGAVRVRARLHPGPKGRHQVHPPHYSAFERIAVVGDRQWEHWMAALCKPFTEVDVRYFDAAESAAAWAWMREVA